MTFDAGSLLFTIKTAGAEVFDKELAQTEKSIQKTAAAAQDGGKKVGDLGTATDAAGKKAGQAAPLIDKQAQATKRTGDENDKATPKLKGVVALTDKQVASAKQVSIALLAAGVAVAALVGLSVAKFAEFDQAMSNVGAATMATRQEQEQLGAAALKAGADTKYSATEAADAEEELAKAGLSVAEIVHGSLNGALALAAAGQLEVARSAEIMATTLKQYKLEGKDSAHVSDLLAAGAGKAQGSVDDLAQALQYVGPVAAGMGISIEETTGVLALFASQGQIGQRAGTGLRGVIQSLVSPTMQAAGVMKQYHVEIFDSNGKMKSLAAVSQELQKAFGGLDEETRSAALGQIFGNEQITAARVLYEGGAEAVQEWTDKVNDTGYAALQAAKRQDNLAGDIEKLGGAFDTALIQTGSGANDVLRDMVQAVTELVDWYGELDPAVQGSALTIGAAAAAVLLLGSAVLGGIAKFNEWKVAVANLNLTMKGTAIATGAAAFALTALAVIFVAVASAQAEAEQKAKSYADTLDRATGKITDSTREMVVENLLAEQSWLWISRGNAADAAEKLGYGMDVVAKAATGNKDALADLKPVMDAYNGDAGATQKLADKAGISFLEASSAASVLGGAIDTTNSQLDRAKVLHDALNEATSEGVSTTQSAAKAYIDASDGVKQMNDELDQLIDQIMEANDVGADAITANIDYQDALAKVDEQIKNVKDGVEGYSGGLDINTASGRDNKSMLVDLAKQSREAAEATFKNDHNTANYKATLEAGRQALIDRATQLGANATEAGSLADQIYRIPPDTEWKVIAKTADARAQLDSLLSSYQNKTISLRAYMELTDRIGSSIHGANGFVSYASGGINTNREHHVAQIARAGEWRVWAEDETGGEAYIPMSPAKRARSTAILQTVADRFGYDLLPRGNRFADGAVSSSVSTSQGGDTINLHVHAGAGTPIDQQVSLAWDTLQREIRAKRRR